MVRISKIISILLCSAVLLGTTGCSTCSTGMHPITDGMACGASIGVAPGVVLFLGFAAISEDDDEDYYDKSERVQNIEDGLFLGSLAAMAGGALIGTAIGAIVGTIDWLTTGPDPRPKYDENYDPNKHP